MSKEKPNFAFYWAASCGGCEIAVLDIDEKILDVADAANIIFWPVAIDTKYKDVEKMEDGSIDVCFFNGAVRTSEQEEIAKLLRRKSKTMISFGSCAYSGGIPGLANLYSGWEIFETAYLDNPSTDNADGKVPETEVRVDDGKLTLPEFYDSVKALHQVVDVDYFLPGCPPPTKLIVKAVEAILNDNLPPKGAILAPERSVCDECRFERSEKRITEIKRVYDVEEVEEKCLLEQGILCYGPATRGGCDARCLDANMPCTGCGGPTSHSLDQGGKMISALASVLGIEGEENISNEEVEKLMDGVVDPAGTFYKYGLPVALLNRRLKR